MRFHFEMFLPTLICKSEQDYSHFCNTPRVETGDEVLEKKKAHIKVSFLFLNYILAITYALKTIIESTRKE